MNRYAELHHGIVKTIFNSALEPHYYKPLSAINLTALSLDDPEPRQRWNGVSFDPALPEKRTYTRNQIRDRLSTISQIKFDKLKSVIDGPGLLDIVPTADQQAAGLPTGVTKRDVLRTAINSWQESGTLHSNNHRFKNALQLLRKYSIVTVDEVSSLTD